MSSRARQTAAATEPEIIRCAIYTRVSTDEGLGQEFNSLHNQREACEAYVTSQRTNGWELLPGQYDDGGFSGGNLQRPALKQLVADIKAGLVQRILVYKIDRLSRSLADFMRLAEVFEKHGASIVAVTQQFDTGTPMGRLTLNMLLSFAQFEREQTAERTHDKMGAARRKGKRTGGMPLLGYDIVDTKLVFNEIEAQQVREIFHLYLEYESIIPVVQELNRRGLRTKSWTTKKGIERHGKPFEKGRVHRILTNWQYAGKVFYEDQVYDGEHDAIVSEEVWNRAQQILQRNRLNGGAHQRSKHGALLNGLLVCGECCASMVHAPSGTKRGRYHRYYTCRTRQQRGKDACPTRSVPAAELESLVVEQIKAIGKDPSVVAAAIAAAQQELQAKRPILEEERDATQVDLQKKHQELNRLIDLVASGGKAAKAVESRLADLQETIEAQGERFREVLAELGGLEAASVDEEDLRHALGLFDPVWDALLPRERVRILHVLLEKVDYRDGKLGLTFRPTGIRTLASEAGKEKEGQL